MNVSLELVTSRPELLEFLGHYQNAVLLGGNDESTREFFQCTINGGVIGVCSQGHGIRPIGLLDEAHEECWIGYNSRVANIDIRHFRVQFEITLDWVFYTILCRMPDGSVVIVYELGACRVSRSGTLIWNHTTDVVTDYSDEGDIVCLRTDEGEVRVGKEQGNVVL
jgi:hypothetical protein